MTCAWTDPKFWMQSNCATYWFTFQQATFSLPRKILEFTKDDTERTEGTGVRIVPVSVWSWVSESQDLRTCFSTLDSTRVFPFFLLRATCHSEPLSHSFCARSATDQVCPRPHDHQVRHCHSLACPFYKSSHATSSSHHAFQKVCPCRKKRHCFQKQDSSFVMSLHSTRVFFRGLLEQHHLSTKSAARLKPIPKDEVHLTSRVRLAHRQLIYSKSSRSSFALAWSRICWRADSYFSIPCSTGAMQVSVHFHSSWLPKRWVATPVRFALQLVVFST